MKENEMLWLGDSLVKDKRILHSNDIKLIVDGEQELYASEFNWEISDDKNEVSLIGCAWNLEIDSVKKGTFKMTRFKTDSSMIKIGFKPFEIMTTVNAGEYGAERIILKNCKMKKIGGDTKAGEALTEEWEGSFAGFKPMDLID